MPVEVLSAVVAGYEAVVLDVSDASALQGWPRDHGYAATPDLEQWARPYVDAQWKITAFKIDKSRPELNVRTVCGQIGSAELWPGILEWSNTLDANTRAEVAKASGIAPATTISCSFATWTSAVRAAAVDRRACGDDARPARPRAGADHASCTVPAQEDACRENVN